MTNKYTPDCWVVIEISGKKVDKPYRRVLAGWYGGYAGSNSWKLSSGIEDMIDRGDHWEIPNHSGSIYYCYKSLERFSMLTGSIFSNYCKDNNEDVVMTHIKIGEDSEISV